MDNTKEQVIKKSAQRLEKYLTSPIASFLILIAIFGAIAYMFFILQPSIRGDTLPYTIVIVSELYLIIYGIISFWTISNGRTDPRPFGFHQSQSELFGENTKSLLVEDSKASASLSNQQLYIHKKPVTVDVFIPVYGESVSEIRDTALAAKSMYGKHKTYILDDGKSDDVRQMAEDIKVGYVRRSVNKHAKAGNINHALEQTKGDYFVILDADFVADKQMLYETIPFFEDSKMSFVQTPQFYKNNINFISTGAGYMQHIFYALIQVGKNKFNAAFCVGTNVIFRRSAIDEIGGIYSASKSEDIWTSMILHEHGYKSVYINNVLAIGKTPETIGTYVKQQLRWATGSFEIFLKRNPLFNKKLTYDQRVQYLMTTMFYFNGFAIAGLLILPALQIYFNLTPISLEIPFYQWALLYSGFYLTQLFLGMLTMGGFKAQTLMLSAASFPIYIKAFFNTLRGKDQVWRATNSVDNYDSPFNYVRVQVYIFVFLLITTAVGIWKSIYTQELSVSIAWNMLNTIIFGVFTIIALREASRMRQILNKGQEPANNKGEL